VQEQIRIADGKPLQYSRKTSRIALCIEFRINAEDPETNSCQPRPPHALLFAGGPRARRRGDLHRLRDSAYFDSMCAKLTV